jgi:hypothetical protein
MNARTTLARAALRTRTGRATTALACAGALLVTGSWTAHAATTTVHDGLDTHARSELTDVIVKNNRRTVVVVLRYNDVSFLHDGEYPFGIFYDTDPVRHGPEYMLPSHFGAVYGTESRRHWSADFDQKQDCVVRGVIHDRIDTFRLTTGRLCFDGHTDAIRVSVDVTEPRPGGGRFVLDWAPGERLFSPWVRRG